MLLRWSTQNEIAVIPKGDTPEQLAQNLQVNDFDLGAEDLAAIEKLDRNIRFNDA